MCNAFSENWGCSGEGVAGTGKTETIIDLARFLGRYCVRQNVSSDYNLTTFKNQIKGSVLSGAWLVFDEFTNLNS